MRRDMGAAGEDREQRHRRPPGDVRNRRPGQCRDSRRTRGVGGGDGDARLPQMVRAPPRVAEQAVFLRRPVARAFDIGNDPVFGGDDALDLGAHRLPLRRDRPQPREIGGVVEGDRGEARIEEIGRRLRIGHGRPGRDRQRLDEPRVDPGGVDPGGGEAVAEVRRELVGRGVAGGGGMGKRLRRRRSLLDAVGRGSQRRLEPRHRGAVVAGAGEQFALHHHRVEVGAVGLEHFVERGVARRAVVEHEASPARGTATPAVPRGRRRRSFRTPSGPPRRRRARAPRCRRRRS